MTNAKARENNAEIAQKIVGARAPTREETAIYLRALLEDEEQLIAAEAEVTRRRVVVQFECSSNETISSVVHTWSVTPAAIAGVVA